MTDRSTQITIETYEVLVISRSSSTRRSWCESCGKEVTVVTLSDASLSRLSEEVIGRQTRSRRFHLIEAVGQPLLAFLTR